MSAGPAATPTTAAASVAAAAGAAQPQAVAVVDATRAVLAQARQVLLEAVVQARGPDGVVTLKTAQGNVQIRATTPLPVGAQLSLEITRNGDQLSARVLAVATQRAASPPAAAVAGQTNSGTASTLSQQISMTTAGPGTRSADPAPSSRGVEFGRATFPAVALAATPQIPPTPTPGGTASQSRMPAAMSAPNAAAGPATAAPPASSTPTAPAQNAATPAQPVHALPASAAESEASAPRPAVPAPAPSADKAPTSGTTALPGTPDPTITTRAASVYAQARAMAPGRDPRTPSPGGRGASSAMPSSATGKAAENQPTSAATKPPPSSGGGAGTGASIAAPMPSVPSAPASRLQPGTTIEVRLAQPPAQQQNGGAATPPARPLPATVVGALPQGRLMVDTPIGRLAVAVPPDLLATPQGDTLDLEWLPETSRAPLGTARQTADGQSTRAWPQARDAAAALLAQADPAARAAADQLVPKPGPRLAQQMMAFIGRGDGDVARWLGDAMMRKLEQIGLAELLARGEAAAAREPDRQPANGEWRHVTVPLFDGQNLHPVEFRARRRNGGERDGARDQSRFVVDCVHDELGAMQIDGLMTTGGARKRLDIILRSRAELPETDRVAISTLFADACGAMGFGGEIAFQVAEQFPVFAGNPLSQRGVIA